MTFRHHKPALALFVAGLAWRPSLVALGPLAPMIVADTGASHAFVGLLTTISILCLGICAPLGPRLAATAGVRAAMAALIGILAAAGSLRGTVSTPVAILALSAAVGLAAGAAGALPPVLTKQRVSSAAIGRVSGLTTAGIATGASLGVVLAIPVASALGGWRPTLVAFGAAAIPCAIAWLFFVGPTPPAGAAISTSASSGRPPAVAWLLAGAFGLQAILYWSAGAWLPATLREQGLASPVAAALVGVLNVAALVGNLGVAALSDRLGSRHRQLTGAVAVAAAGCIGLMLGPLGALPAAALVGLGCGATYPLILACAVDIAQDAHTAGQIASLVALVGYPVAAVGPFLFGVARDITGDYGTTIPGLMVGSVALVITAAAFARKRQRRLAPAP